MGLVNHLSSVPRIFRGIMIGALVIMVIDITYPIANHILGLFTDGTMMKYSAIVAYWIIIVFVTWFLVWIIIFKVDNLEGGATHG